MRLGTTSIIEHGESDSGYLVQATPTSPLLNPPVEITRCLLCWRAWEEDGTAQGTIHDEERRAALWKAHREAQQAAEALPGLFEGEEAA